MTLKKAISGATATAGALAGIFQLDLLVVLVAWGWTNLGQLFYMGTLLVSSSNILPISRSMASLLIGGLAALLLLKTILKARKEIAKRTD
jgi:hypothetical protein